MCAQIMIVTSLLKIIAKVLEVEDQLLWPVLQEQAGDDYDKLKTTFECFQQKLRRVTLQVKQEK